MGYATMAISTCTLSNLPQTSLFRAKPVTALPPSPVRCISSQRLLAGEREVVIEHMGNAYHLRLTRNGKLILTK